MIQTYFGLEYLIWETDANLFKTKTFLNDGLRDAFDLKKKITSQKPNELIGDGGTLPTNVVVGLHGFKLLHEVLKAQVEQKFELFTKSKSSILSLDRCWANELKKDAMGRIHNHPNKFVLIFYFNANEETSNLVFIDPKNKDKLMRGVDSVSDSDILNIKTSTGMCVLHDGEILHTISKHESVEPRHSFIFEFSLVDTGFRKKEAWQSG